MTVTNGRELGDEFADPAADERFPAREADLPDPDTDEYGGDPGDLVEVEQGASSEQGVIGAEALCGMQ